MVVYSLGLISPRLSGPGGPFDPGVDDPLDIGQCYGGGEVVNVDEWCPTRTGLDTIEDQPPEYVTLRCAIGHMTTGGWVVGGVELGSCHGVCPMSFVSMCIL